MKLHKLKLIYTHFKDVKYDDRKNVRNLYKKFEIRINDRDYRAGDLLLLLEYDKASYSPYSGDGYFCEINYILDLKYTTLVPYSDYVILGLNPICLADDGEDLLNNNIDYKPFLNLTDEECLKELLELMEHKNVGCWEKWKELVKKL